MSFSQTITVFGPVDYGRAEGRTAEATKWIDEYSLGTSRALYEEMLAGAITLAQKAVDDKKAQLAPLMVERPDRITWSYADFLYFSIITQAAGGTGDMMPNTTAVRLVVVVQLLLATLLLVVVIDLFLESGKKEVSVDGV